MHSIQRFNARPFNKAGNISRKFIAIAACSLIGPSLHAQKGFDFGIRANIQTTSLLNNSDEAAGPELDYKNKSGIAYGAGAGYTLSKHFGVGLDILYSKQVQDYKGVVANISATPAPDLSGIFKGLATENGIALAGTYTAERSVSYIKIPIMLRYTGNSMKKVYFSSFIGPQISLLSAADYKIDDQQADFSQLHMDAKDTYKKMTLDAVLGIGAAMNVSDHIVVSLQLRCDYGLSNAEDKNATYTTSTGSGNFYTSDRANTQNASAGAFISVSYRLVKKTASKSKTATSAGHKK